ncbi:MAG TPA: outer membrane protein assembly factor BamD [Gemmatimonadales bacterium]|jgi:outer membrane protein assembly factor BamD
MSKVSLVAILALLGACTHHYRPPKVSLTALNASPKTVDSLWNVAMDFYNRHKWDKAAAAFDRVELEMSPGDRRVLLGRIYLGDLYAREGSSLQAVREYRRLVDEFPTDSLAPEALFRAADAYFRLWRAPDLDPTYAVTAQSVDSEVITRYPNTPAATKAQAQLRELENRFAERDYKSANFYFKLKGYEAAILYLKNLVFQYPRATVAPDALALLVKAYRKLNYAEDLKDICTYMGTNWGTTPQYRSSCPQVAAQPPTDATHAGKPAGP